MHYVGRYAPSPTGPLHFGSLIAAVASYLEARTRQGRWLVRMEDLDSAREIPGAAQHILQTLQDFGFEWDGQVLYQSQRNEAYNAALDVLQRQAMTYPCACTRKEIADSAVHGIDGLVYPGICRHGLPEGKTARAWRLRSKPMAIGFIDAIQGQQCQQLDRDIGDFVLKRADGLYAYQLAVVVDDAAQGITHVVRGADLLDSTPRQIYLQQLLMLPQPHYTHVPVAANSKGEKLSKQTRALPLDPGQASETLWQALQFLGQQPPAELAPAGIDTIWQWALSSWQVDHIPRQRSQQVQQAATSEPA